MSATGPETASFRQADDPAPGPWQHPAAGNAFINVDVESAKSRYNWFVCLHSDGRQLILSRKELPSVLSAEILGGRLQAAAAADIYKKTGDRWSQDATTVRNIANKNFKLKVLYQPMWAHAKWGGIWGFFIGAALFALNSLLANFFVNAKFAALMCVAFAAIFIPRIGKMISGVCFLLLGIFGQLIPVFAVLAAILTGMILGVTSGVAIGGATAYVRQENLPKAPDAEPEASHLVWTTFVLPSVVAVALWSFYFFVVFAWASTFRHGAMSLRLFGF